MHEYALNANDVIDKTISRSESAPAVVFPLDDLPGLQAARILSDRNIPTIGIARERGHPFCRTNSCDRVEIGNCDNIDGVNKLLKLGSSLSRKGVLIPCSDLTVLMVARHRERLSRFYYVPPADLETLEMLMDKTKFAAFAGANGLLVPKTVIVQNKADADQASRDLTFPCVVKPNIKTPEWFATIRSKVVVINTSDEWEKFYARVPASVDKLILQEWVVGPETNLYSCNCYFDLEGKPVTSFVARKIRQWPPEIGISSLGQEVQNDHVRDETLRLFTIAGLKGLGYLEMKQDDISKKYFVIEANVGRPTGRSAIAEAGDVELLYAAYLNVQNLPLPDNLTQQFLGVKWINILSDLRSAHHYWRKGELTFSGWWQSLQGRKCYAVWSWRDPAPFLYLLAKSLLSFLTKSRKR